MTSIRSTLPDIATSRTRYGGDMSPPARAPSGHPHFRTRITDARHMSLSLPRQGISLHRRGGSGCAWHIRGFPAREQRSRCAPDTHQCHSG
eukprot:12908690-Prorocentrum_lima.AAC.1